MLFLIYETAYGANSKETVQKVLTFLGARTDIDLPIPDVVNAAPSPETLIQFDEEDVVVEGKRYKGATPQFRERAERARELIVKALADDYERAVWRVFFAEEVRRLENLIGQDLSIWRERYR